MRPWLLLLSLLVSDLSPLGDGDGVLEYSSWTLCRKLLQIQGNWVYVAVPHQQRTAHLYWAQKVHDEHGCSLSHQECTGITHKKALAVSVFLGQRKSVPASTRPMLLLLHGISESSRITMDIIKDRPDSWELNHHADASGCNFRGFLLEKSKSRATASIVQVQKMLTKRFCVIISCCFEEGEVRSAMKIKKEVQIREKDSVKGINGQAVVSQRDVFQAGTETSHISQLDIQRNPIIVRKIEHLNSLQWRVQRQRPLKAASSLYDEDDDGFYVKKQLLLASRETKKSINGARCKTKATQDDNKEDFNGKKQAEFRRPEAESETERLQIANVNQKTLAYILQAARKTDNNDADQKLSEAAQTQVNTDTGWETVNILIKKLSDLLLIKGNFKESWFSLEMCARTERIAIKPAESKETTASEEQVKETTEEAEDTEADNHTPHENTDINHAKQEENVPSLNMTETKTERVAVNMEIEETTSSVDVFSTETPRTTTSPESETGAEITSEIGDIRATTVEASGLRMKEDVTADLPETQRQEDQNDPEVDSFTSAKPLQTLPKATDASKPLCGGLIHRTEAGRRLCAERAAGTGSEMFASSEPTENTFNDDNNEYDHFYYFDGVLRRVQNYFYPYYKRQKRPKTSYDNTENFLSFIRRLSLQNKVNYFK